jgi:hypothetical protein
MSLDSQLDGLTVGEERRGELPGRLLVRGGRPRGRGRELASARSPRRCGPAASEASRP